MELYDRKGKPIEDWRGWTRPKEERQWKAGRSAMELARAWFTAPAPTVPAELAALLASRSETADVVLEQGWPEFETKLPERGEGRNHDLVLLGRGSKGRVLVTVEAKVDETMGPSIATYWRASKRNKEVSFAWRRIDALLKCAFGETAAATEEPWGSLPYQLLTALVGTAVEAKRRECPQAILILHEFITESAVDKRLRENAAGFDAFLRSLDGRATRKPGVLYGPYAVTFPNSTRQIPVLIGKAEYRWRTA